MLLCALAAPARAEIDKSIVRHEIRTHNAEFQACYAAGLKADPKLEGKVTVTFVIDSKGHVPEVRAEGMPAIDACIEGVFSKMQFPKPPKNTGVISVSYPLVFNIR